MARYKVEVASTWDSKTAFAYMADMTNYAEWDRGIKKVVQTQGTGGGLGSVFDVTVRGFAGRDSVLTYATTEYVEGESVLLIGKNSMFTSVDRIVVSESDSGCSVTYDATLTLNGLLSPLNLALGLVFNRIGDVAAAGLRKKLTK